MSSAMNEDKLHHYLQSLAEGIDACLAKELWLPALILLYSAIEIVGNLSNDDPNAGTRAIFENWVKKYLLPVRMLYCNEVDLYGARCGLVHTLTPYSDLSEKGKARTVCYAWAGANAEFLQQTINQSGRHHELVAVHVNDLYHGWKHGVEQFLQDLRSDPERRERVLERAGRFFSHIPVDKGHEPALDKSYF